MDYLYETPWWLPTGIALVGVVLISNGRGRLLKRAGIVIVVLAAALAVAGHLLESDRERVVASSARLIRAAGAGQWDTVRSVLHPDVAVRGMWNGRDEVLSNGRAAAERWALRWAEMSATTPGRQVDNEFSIQVQARARFEEGVANVSNWELIWIKEGDRWLLYEVSPVDGPGLAAEMVRQYMRGRPR